MNRQRENNPKFIIGYCRLMDPKSNIDPNAKANHHNHHHHNYNYYTIDDQIKLIHAYSEHSKIPIKCIYIEDNKNCFWTKRPELTKLLDNLEENELVVVSNIAKLANNLNDTLVLLNLIEEKNAYFLDIESKLDTINSYNQTIINSLITINEYQKTRNILNTKIAMNELSSNNKLKPKCPYGWRKTDNGYIIDEEEQKTIKFMRELVEEQPTIKLTHVRNLLIKHKYPPGRKAKQWYNSRVKQIAQQNNIPLDILNKKSIQRYKYEDVKDSVNFIDNLLKNTPTITISQIITHLNDNNIKPIGKTPGWTYSKVKKLCIDYDLPLNIFNKDISSLIIN